MANTNSTPNYQLPLFIPEDKPSWLGSWNDAMSKIDAGINGASRQGDTNAQGVLDNKNAIAELDGRVTQNEEDIKDHATKIQALETTGVVILPGGTLETLTTAEITAGSDNTIISVDDWRGGFFGLSVDPSVASINALHAMGFAVTTGATLLHLDNSCHYVKAGGKNMSTDLVFIPAGVKFMATLSIDAGAVNPNNITALYLPYKAYPVSTITQDTGSVEATE